MLTGYARVQVLDALTMDPDAARDEAGAAMLPLEPVMETTERSTFGKHFMNQSACPYPCALGTT